MSWPACEWCVLQFYVLNVWTLQVVGRSFILDMVASVVVLMECMFLCIFVALSNCVVDQGWYLVYVMTSMRMCVLQFYVLNVWTLQVVGRSFILDMVASVVLFMECIFLCIFVAYFKLCSWPGMVFSLCHDQHANVCVAVLCLECMNFTSGRT